MKTGILIALLVLANSVFCQTKLIAHKSHSGTPESFRPEHYSSNFGEMEILFPVEKVKLWKNNCLIEFRTDKTSDTFCNHPYVSGQYTFEQIKLFYPENTVFVGFEGKFFNHTAPNQGKQKKNSLHWISLLFFLGGAGLIVLKPVKGAGVRKSLVCFIILFSAPLVTAQTKLIAHKSHSGRAESFTAANYSDNFGIKTPSIKAIKLIKNNCIVEIPYNGPNDTVCDHPNFTGQYTLDEIKAFYPKNTEFIGFEGKFLNTALPENPKKNSFHWIVLLFFLGGAGVVFVKSKT